MKEKGRSNSYGLMDKSVEGYIFAGHAETTKFAGKTEME